MTTFLLRVHLLSVLRELQIVRKCRFSVGADIMVTSVNLKTPAVPVFTGRETVNLYLCVPSSGARTHK